jgi:hypothetical protein
MQEPDRGFNNGKLLGHHYMLEEDLFEALGRNP